MFGNLVIAAILALLVGCSQPKYVQESPTTENKLAQENADCRIKLSISQLCLQWSWQLKPTTKQAGILVFKTYRLNQLDQTPVETELSGTADVVLWMPDMGHGSTPTKTERIDVGTYRVSQVFFIMPGKWEIRFQIKNENKVLESAIVEIII